MRKTVLWIGTAALLAACADTPSTAPKTERNAETARAATSALHPVVVDNGDGTSTLTFQPGPGRNDGTDQGTLDAGKDAAYGLAGGVAYNWGASGFMHHWKSNCNAFQGTSLYRFDVSSLPAADDIISVRLSLYNTFVRSYGWPWQTSVTHFTLSPVYGDWNEMTVAPGNAPEIGTPIATVALETMPPRLIYPPQSAYTYYEGWATMDVTALYRAWRSGAQPNFGVAYQRSEPWCENANSELVTSSDILDDPASVIPARVEHRPKLTILYRSAQVNRPPTVTASGPATVAEGSTITLSANGSDPDGDALSYAWQFDDGFTADGMVVSRIYPDDGAHSASITVSDGKGGTASATVTFSVTNVAPSVTAMLSGEILLGEMALGSGAFSDPGHDEWLAEVNWGDLSVPEPLALSGTSFNLSHRYMSAGVFAWTVTVRDDDGGDGSISGSVSVLSLDAWLDRLIARINNAGYDKGLANSLVKKLEAAKKSLQNGSMSAAKGQLGAFRNELDATTKTGRIPAADGAAYLAMLDRVLALL